MARAVPPVRLISASTEAASPKSGRSPRRAAPSSTPTDLIVAPGVVDPHTHYDAQLFWDPTASPSNLHGVTTVIGGNCGFTLAPIKAGDADYIRRMMAKVEGMPLAALEQGVPWSWASFGEYLAALEGNLGVNAGFLVGHCAVRRHVMGAARAEEVATDDEIAAMRALMADSLAAGGLGFSSSQSRTHSDGDGRPITSRYADRREMMAFCEEVAAHEGTTLEYITNGCLDQFSDEEIDLMTAMSVTAQRPLNWNVLTIDGRSADMVDHQLSASTRAAEAGGRIVALTMPTLVPMNMSFGTFCALFLMPGWGEVMGLPPEERMAKLADPDVRAMLDQRAKSKEAGSFRGLGNWGTYVIGDTYAAANEGYQGQKVRDIAAARGSGRLRHPARHRAGRRAAHRPVAQHRRRQRQDLGPAGGGLDRPQGDDRRVRRRRAPRPHVRIELSHDLPGGLPPGAPAGPAHPGRAHAERAAGPALRAPRPRRAGSGQRGRRLRLRPRHGGLGAGANGPRSPR